MTSDVANPIADRLLLSAAEDAIADQRTDRGASFDAFYWAPKWWH